MEENNKSNDFASSFQKVSNELMGIIETLLFLSDRPLSIEKIMGLLPEETTPQELEAALTQLQEDYNHPHRGVMVQKLGNAYQIRTRPQYAQYAQKLSRPSTLSLGPTALEVLAIVAYRQPISRSEIDRIRGVDSSHVIRIMMDKRLIKMSGRSDDLGRPTLYTTTSEFLSLFNLASLDDLPPEYELETLSVKSSAGNIEDIKELISRTSERDELGEIEIEELDRDLKNINIETQFTKELKNSKSSFEILEDYLLKEDIAQENQRAALSQLPTSLEELGEIKESTLEEGPKLEDEISKQLEIIDKISKDIDRHSAELKLPFSNEDGGL